MADAARKPRAARAPTDLPVEVRCAAGRFRASGRDLSVTGMRIRGRFHASRGERIFLTLDLPTPHQMGLMAEVRWVREEEPEDRVLGVRFVHSSETQRKVQHLLEEIQSGKLGVLRSPAQTRRVPKVGGGPPPGERTV